MFTIFNIVVTDKDESCWTGKMSPDVSMTRAEFFPASAPPRPAELIASACNDSSTFVVHHVCFC